MLDVKRDVLEVKRDMLELKKNQDDFFEKMLKKPNQDAQDQDDL